MSKIKGDSVSIEWGSQIRNYVLHPYKMVKDLRTGVETSNVESVLDGEIENFIEAEVKKVEIEISRALKETGTMYHLSTFII